MLLLLPLWDWEVDVEEECGVEMEPWRGGWVGERCGCCCCGSRSPFPPLLLVMLLLLVPAPPLQLVLLLVLSAMVMLCVAVSLRCRLVGTRGTDDGVRVRLEE